MRGARLLKEADVSYLCGFFGQPELLAYASEGAEIHNSAAMTLEEVMAVIRAAEDSGKNHCAPAYRRFKHLWRGAGAV